MKSKTFLDDSGRFYIINPANTSLYTVYSSYKGYRNKEQGEIVKADEAIAMLQQIVTVDEKGTLNVIDNLKKNEENKTKKKKIKRFIGDEIENKNVLKKIQRYDPLDEDVPKFVKLRGYLFSQFEIRYNTILNDFEGLDKTDVKKGYRTLNSATIETRLFEKRFTNFSQMVPTILNSDYVAKYNPIKGYFNSLPAWDETKPDYINKLANYVQAVDQDWFNTQFKKMLVRVIACGVGIIPFNKQCFILSSGQNCGKSTFFRFLCPPTLSDFYRDGMDFQNKDGRLSLAQNLFINLDELADLSWKDINAMKSVITFESIKERKPYGKKSEKFNRIASFFGSTNEIDFLTDVTGNVRFMIFEILGIKHDDGGPEGYNANIDIDNVYAQAVWLLKNGFDFKLTKEELEKSELTNRKHLVRTAEMEAIPDFFESAEDGEMGGKFMTATSIKDYIQTRTTLKLNSRNVGRALKFLNYNKASSGSGNKKRSGYYVIERRPTQKTALEKEAEEAQQQQAEIDDFINDF